MRGFSSFIILSCMIFSALAHPRSAAAFEETYLPLSRNTLSHRIPQKLKADPLQSGQSINVGNTKLEISPLQTLQIHGTDKSAKPWSYQSTAWTGSASVWTADLDKNGTEDLIVLMHTGGCGWAPPCQLLVLMFEKNGRPIPWVTDGFFEVDSHGIKDFIDAGNDGHCQLVRQSFDDGYWMTSFYEANSSHFHRLNNVAGTQLPLYTRFTESSNHRAIKIPAYRHPFEADLSNNCGPARTWQNDLASASSRETKYLNELEWANVSSSENPCLTFSDGTHSHPAAWYSSITIVLDDAAGRRMASLSASEAAHHLLSEIKNRRLPVAVSGTRVKSSKGSPLSCEFIFASGQNNRLDSRTSPHASKRLDPILASSTELP